MRANGRQTESFPCTYSDKAIAPRLQDLSELWSAAPTSNRRASHRHAGHISGRGGPRGILAGSCGWEARTRDQRWRANKKKKSILRVRGRNPLMSSSLISSSRLGKKRVINVVNDGGDSGDESGLSSGLAEGQGGGVRARSDAGEGVWRAESQPGSDCHPGQKSSSSCWLVSTCGGNISCIPPPASLTTTTTHSLSVLSASESHRRKVFRLAKRPMVAEFAIVVFGFSVILLDKHLLNVQSKGLGEIHAMTTNNAIDHTSTLLAVGVALLYRHRSGKSRIWGELSL